MSEVHVVGAAICRAGTCLVAQRGSGMRLAGKWEFPGGKVDSGESFEAALVREIAEELGVEIAIGPWLGRGTARVDGKTIVLDVFAATLVTGTIELHEHAEIRWLTPSEFESVDWAEADIPVLPEVAAFLRQNRP